MVDRRKIKSMVKKSRYLQWYVTKCTEFGSPRKHSTRQETVLPRSPELRGSVKRNKGRSALKFQSIYKQFVDGRKNSEECESKGMDNSIGNSDLCHGKSPNTLSQTTPSDRKGSNVLSEQQESASERSFFGEFGRYLNAFNTTGTTPSSRCETLQQSPWTVTKPSTTESKHENCQISKTVRCSTEPGSTEATQLCLSNRTLSPSVAGSKCLPLKKRMSPSHNVSLQTSEKVVLKSILKSPRPVFKRNLALSRSRKISFANHVDVAVVNGNGDLVKTSKTIAEKHGSVNKISLGKSILKPDTVTEVVLPKKRSRPILTPAQVALSGIVKRLKLDRINGSKSNEDAMISTKLKPRSSLSQIVEGKRLTSLIDPQHKKRKSMSLVTSPKRQKTTASGISSKSGSETSPVENVASKNAPVAHNDGKSTTKGTSVKLKLSEMPTGDHDVRNSKHVQHSRKNAEKTCMSLNVMETNRLITQRSSNERVLSSCGVERAAPDSLLEKPNNHNASPRKEKEQFTIKSQHKTSEVSTPVTNSHSPENSNGYNPSPKAETEKCIVNDASSVRNSRSPANTNDHTTSAITETQQCVGGAELTPYEDATSGCEVRSPANTNDHNSSPNIETDPCTTDKTLLNSYEDETSVKNARVPANTNDHITSPVTETEQCVGKAELKPYEDATPVKIVRSPANTNHHTTSPKTETEPCTDKTLLNSYEGATPDARNPASTNDHITSPRRETEPCTDKTLFNSYEDASDTRNPANTNDHTTSLKTETEHFVDEAERTPQKEGTSVRQSRRPTNTENDNSSSKPKCLARIKVTSVRLFSCNNCDQRFVSLAKLGAHLPIHRTPQLDMAAKENPLMQQKDEMLSDIMDVLCKMNGGNKDKSSCVPSEVENDPSGDNNVITNELQNTETSHCDDKNPDVTLLHNRVDTIIDVYHCNHCGRKFKNINNLKRHEAAHTMEKTYKCGFCNQMFSLGSERNKHEYTHVGAETNDCSCN